MIPKFPFGVYRRSFVNALLVQVEELAQKEQSATEKTEYYRKEMKRAQAGRDVLGRLIDRQRQHIEEVQEERDNWRKEAMK